METAIDALCTLPPVIQHSKSIYKESDVEDFFGLEIVHRCQVLFNTLFPTLHLQFNTQWAYFPGITVDASVDLIWRIEHQGTFFNVAITEFKRPGSINIHDSEQGFIGVGRLGDKARDQSQQLTRYLFALNTTFIHELSDLINTVAVFLQAPPRSLQKGTVEPQVHGKEPRYRQKSS